MTDSTPTTHERRGILAWIVLHPKSTFTIVVALLLLAAALLSHHAANTRLQRRIDAIRARGEPVTIDDINAALPNVPPERNRAFVLLERTKRMTQEAATMRATQSEEFLRLPLFGSSFALPTGVALPQEQIEAIHWFLAQYPEELAGIREVLAMSEGTYDVQLITPTISVLLPGLSEYREIGRIIALQAILHAEARNSEAATESLIDLLRLGRVLECEYPFLITTLVQISLDNLALDRIERTVNNGEIDTPSLERLQRAVAQIESGPNMRQTLLTERVNFLDNLSWAVTGGGGGLQALTGVGGVWFDVWSYIPGLASHEAGVGLDLYTSILGAVESPSAQSMIIVKQFESDVINLPDYYVYCRTVIPSFSRSIQLWLQGVGKNRALQAALAAERYRLERGDWPESLSDLVPDYLDAVPVDPFDGKPIRYSGIPEGVCVWTIGEDLKDDGGNVMRVELPTRNKPATDFGWVILNPDLRGRPAEETEPASDKPAPPWSFE